MKASRILLLAVAALVVWKAVRTDWIVVAPYWFHDADPPASDVYTTDIYTPPLTPIWLPPTPNQLDSHAKSWADFFPGGGAYGITGPPVLRPNWFLMAIKLFVAFLVVCPAAFVFAGILRRLSNTHTRDSQPR